MSPEWINTAVGFCGLFLTVTTLLLNAIRVVLNGLRADIKEIASQQITSSMRIIVMEEKIKGLKCQECKN